MQLITLLTLSGAMKTEVSTRERILQAAFELICDKGFAGACTREIAQQAGVAEVTLSRHFTSKENLFRQTTEQCSSIPVIEAIIPVNMIENEFVWEGGSSPVQFNGYRNGYNCVLKRIYTHITSRKEGIF